MATPKMYRHGDVMFVSVPTGLSALSQKGSFGHEFSYRRDVDWGEFRSVGNRMEVLKGEVTGHAHVLTSDEPIRAERASPHVEDRHGLVASISLSAPGKLTHQEHNTLTLPPGNYDVLRQREWWGDESRKVVD